MSTISRRIAREMSMRTAHALAHANDGRYSRRMTTALNVVINRLSRWHTVNGDYSTRLNRNDNLGQRRGWQRVHIAWRVYRRRILRGANLLNLKYPQVTPEAHLAAESRCSELRIPKIREKRRLATLCPERLTIHYWKPSDN